MGIGETTDVDGDVVAGVLASDGSVLIRSDRPDEIALALVDALGDRTAAGAETATATSVPLVVLDEGGDVSDGEFARWTARLEGDLRVVLVGPAETS